MQTPRTGRPPKPDAERKSKWLRVRVTPGLKRRVEEAAEETGVSTPEYVRARLDGRHTEAMARRTLRRDLRAVGQALQEAAGQGSTADLKQAVDEVRQALGRAK